MKETKYGYAVARTRAWENSLLDQNRLERLLAAPSLKEALAQLSDSVYHGELEALTAPQDYEEALEAVIDSVYEEMAQMGHGKEIQTLKWRYDLANCKLLLRAERQGIEPRGLSSLGKQELSDFPPSWQEAIAKGREAKDPQSLDLILDRAFFEAVLVASLDPFLEAWWRLEIDLINIRTFARLAAFGAQFSLWEAAFLEGGELKIWSELQALDLKALAEKLQLTSFHYLFQESLASFKETGSWALLEKLADNYQLEYLRGAKYIPFGPEPLAAFVLAREHEAKLLRIIFAGKANNLEGSEIRERLREVYGE